MARPSKDEIQFKIQQAVVEIVVKNGVGAASVGEIAKHARVSAGTIYLHYDNKEDMLRKVYMQIKTQFHELMVASSAEASSAEMIKRMWFDMFAFAETHPLDFQFIEDAGMIATLTADQRLRVAAMGGAINDLVQRAIDDRTLDDMPVGVAVNLLMGPAILLAKRQAHTATAASQDILNQTFERVWRAVTS
ncbi:MAG: TetR/AcrR family transcriptional regulator [Pseudomonadota bacterium]